MNGRWFLQLASWLLFCATCKKSVGNAIRILLMLLVMAVHLRRRFTSAQVEMASSSAVGPDAKVIIGPELSKKVSVSGYEFITRMEGTAGAGGLKMHPREYARLTRIKKHEGEQSWRDVGAQQLVVR